jgi:serine/threonine-protein kinase RIO1
MTSSNFYHITTTMRFSDLIRPATRSSAQQSTVAALRGCELSACGSLRLQSLIEEKLIDTMVLQLMSGKEAAVYKVPSGDDTLCAKVIRALP